MERGGLSVRWRKWMLWLMIGGIVLGGVPVNAEDASEVSAASAVMMQADSGRILYQKDAHTPRAMASTTKIMTALLAAERLPLDRDVSVSAQAVRVEGTALGLRGGDAISVRDLITGLLLASGNDAANVLAQEVAGSQEAFAVLMNQRAVEIGMKHTHFVTPSGLDAEGHASTAYDMALLAREALKNGTIAAIVQQKSATIRLGSPKRAITIANHNRLLQLYPDAIGMKTGFTKKAGRCLVSAAKRDGMTLIVVTLHCPNDWDDHMHLYDAAFAKVKTVPLPMVKLPTLRVAGGDRAGVRLTIADSSPVAVMQDEAERIRTRLELPAFVWGGVKKGARVGWAIYAIDGQELARVPVLATEDAATLPVAGYAEQCARLFCRMLQGLLTW